MWGDHRVLGIFPTGWAKEARRGNSSRTLGPGRTWPRRGSQGHQTHHVSLLPPVSCWGFHGQTQQHAREAQRSQLSGAWKRRVEN